MAATLSDVDLAALGLVVEDGQVIKATDSLKKLGDAGELAAGRVRNAFQRGGFTTGLRAQQEIMASMSREAAAIAPRVQQVNQQVRELAVVTERGAVQTGMLRQGLFGLAAAATGVQGPMGRVLQGLLLFGGGSGLVLGVAAGIGAIATAYNALTKSAREAAAEIRDVEKAQRERVAARAGAAGVGQAEVGVLNTERSRILREIVEAGERLQAARQRAPGLEPSVAMILAENAALRDMVDLYGQLKTNTQQLAASTGLVADAHGKTREELEKEVRDAANLLLELQKVADVQEKMVQLRQEVAREDVWQREKKRLQEAKQAMVDLLGFAEKYKQAKAAIQAQQDKEEAAASARSQEATGLEFIQVVSSATDVRSLLTQLPGLLGGVGSAVGGLIGTLFGAADRAREAARRLREAQEQFGRSMEAFRDSVSGTSTDLEASIRGVREQAAALRREAEAAGGIAGAPGSDIARLMAEIADWEFALTRLGFTENARRITIEREIERLRAVIAAMSEINDLERERIEQLRAEAAEVQRRIREDLQVRLLRARGRDEEADAMAQAVAQQREYADALRDGADAATLALLAQVHAAEAQRRAIDGLKERVASLTSTIDDLRAFSDSLKLGPLTTLSPVQQLAEARRQYEALVTQARGGDQAAASRLPDAARAFLEASRVVNASGGRFQVDFTRVLRETEEIAGLFAKERTAAEKQLAVLEQIERNTYTGPAFPPRRDPKDVERDDAVRKVNEEMLVELAASVAVLQDGFKLMLAEQAATKLAVQDGTAATRTGFEGLKF